ncbi:MAG: hypothetical protein M9899_01200 [Bdellovibrionaceae bacterium]|nr:hypothetical protein [Pseudobdellovibrionaceae bacterium]
MSLFKKIFGGKKSEAESFVETKMQTLLDKAGFKLSFDLKVSEEDKKILVDLYGEDEEILKDRDAQLLDGFQLFLKRSLQHNLPEEKVSVIVDSGSYREKADDELYQLAEKLKGLVLKKKKAVYFRALPPRERKLVHQYLSEDKRFKTKSVGEGIYKKIKIFLVNSKPNPNPSNAKNSNGKRPNSKFKEKNGNVIEKEEFYEVNGNVALPDDDFPDENFNS